MHLWVVPAQVQGLWCAPGASLEVTQRFQTFSATLTALPGTTPIRVFDGHVTGATLRAHEPAGLALSLRGRQLQLDHIVGPGADLAGRRFERAATPACT